MALDEWPNHKRLYMPIAASCSACRLTTTKPSQNPNHTVKLQGRCPNGMHVPDCGHVSHPSTQIHARALPATATRSCRGRRWPAACPRGSRHTPSPRSHAPPGLPPAPTPPPAPGVPGISLRAWKARAHCRGDRLMASPDHEK